MTHQKLNYLDTRSWTLADPTSPEAQRRDAQGENRDNQRTKVSLGITNPPPSNNPLSADGTLGNCCSSPIVTAWLTDSDGDMTFATVNLTGGPPPTGWNCKFPLMPPGEYIFTVQIQCNTITLSQSIYVTL